jgi:superfamily II DNA or RNA helicase
MPATAAPFAFRAFQVDDLARAAMHDGLVLGWDPGLYKSGAAYVWPMLKKARRVLIIAPEQLHDQIIEEGQRFGITPRRLMNLEDFYGDDILVRAGLAVTGGCAAAINASPASDYWITSYMALGYNGGDMWTPKEKENGELILNSTIIDRRQAHQLYNEEFDHGIGEIKTVAGVDDSGPASPMPATEIRCVFTPTLALLCAGASRTGSIFDCVVCDEAVRIKSNETYCSLGVRMLTQKYRLVLTATPIKNHLDDIFWLCQWACGGHPEPTARWPYPNTNTARETFANEHMLIEQNHTKEKEHQQRTGRHKTFKKRTPKICNIHRLWKLLGPVVLRRRKDDTGEEIVPKTIIPIRVKPGTAQQIVYRFHLDNPPKIAKNGNPMERMSAIVAQLQNLRQAALCPDSPNLSEIGLSMHGLRQLIKKAKHNPLADLALTEKAVLVARKGDRTPFEGERDVALTILDRMARTGKIDVAKIIEAAPGLEQKLRPFIVDLDARKHARSWTDHNPKQAAILKLIEELISKGEQVVVVSPFQHFSQTLYRRLIEANVTTCLLDGNVSPDKRGKLARQFKQKRFAVLVGGIKSMGEGFSFECANNLILPSIEWAFDNNKQSIDRVHRLISEKPVTIYTLVTTNTIDERLESVFCEKTDSSNLALDGRLFADKTDEINLGKLLADAIRDFNPAAETIPENNIEEEWESTLRSKLRVAEQRFREFWPPVIPDITGMKMSAAEVRRAMDKLSRETGTGIGSIINCIPSATIGALIGSADRARIEMVRMKFSEFCAAKNHDDWKRAWRAFEATGVLEKI